MNEELVIGTVNRLKGVCKNYDALLDKKFNALGENNVNFDKAWKEYLIECGMFLHKVQAVLERMDKLESGMKK